MLISGLRSMGTRSLPVAVACLLCGPAWAAANDSGSTATESAVWKEKELTFTYTGFTTRYSCDGLRDKVWTALVQMGANTKDLQVRPIGCSSPSGRPDPFPGVKVKMRVLEPAGGADTTGNQAPVQAHWKPVDLKLSDFDRNESGECELVEQIHLRLLPLFTTRNVDFRSDCIPHQASPVGSSLRFDVLAVDQKAPGDDKSKDGQPKA